MELVIVESMAENLTDEPTSARLGAPDSIDIHVGRRVKIRRTLLRISQEQLAGDIGVTFQQVQKYESGHNRVSASRLFDISCVLDCPVSYFFEDISNEVISGRTTPEARIGRGLQESPPGHDNDPMRRTETLELVRAYWRLHSAELRRNFLDLLSNMPNRG